MSESIKVVVRVRPMNSKQRDKNCTSIINVDETNGQIVLMKPGEEDNIKPFAFDSVFGENSEQAVVYTKTAYNLVENIILGYNGTIFAYGQTGCGKTHSMVGLMDHEEQQGIIPRSFGHILTSISGTKDKQFLLRCSFLQIYNEEVRDLLGKDIKAKLQIKESPQKGVFIKDLSINSAKTHNELMSFMQIGNKNRTVGETAMNKDSSRSHLIFMLYLQSASLADQGGEKKYIASKLNLVDLAGSQRLSKTGASGDRLKQAQKINLSLSALGNVISTLVDGKSQHIPYRDSKLTRLLQDSLGGNTKTVMMANCSPADYNFDETLSTLRYASRAKFIKNKPVINEDPKDALLKEYSNEIQKLRAMLEERSVSKSMPVSQVNLMFDERLKEKEQELRNEKEEKQMLMAKIKQLQAKSIQAKDVEIDDTVIKGVAKVRELGKLQKTIAIPARKLSIEDDEMEMESQKSAFSKTDYKAVVKKLKQRIKQLQLQVKDVMHENYVQKELILDDVRTLTKENKLLEAMITPLLKPSEIEQVREAAEYNEDKQEYRIPPFYIKNKEVIFPKLSDCQGMDMIRQLQQGRKIQWGESQKQNSKPNSRSMQRKELPERDMSISELLHAARKERNKIPFKKADRKIAQKLILEPIQKV